MDANDPARRHGPRATGRGFYACLALLLLAFAAVVWQRHEIRALGWKLALASSDEFTRERAGRSLAFMTQSAGARRLIESAEDKDPNRAEAAVAALALLDSPESLEALHRAAQTHPVPRVRAQAIESILIRLLDETPSIGSVQRGPNHDANVRIFTRGLSDDGRFSGLLCLERQVAAASRFAGLQPTSTPSERSVADVAKACLERLNTSSVMTNSPTPAREAVTPPGSHPTD